MLKCPEQTFAAQIRNGMFSVQPDVFKFVLCHSILEGSVRWGYSDTCLTVTSKGNNNRRSTARFAPSGAFKVEPIRSSIWLDIFAPETFTARHSRPN